MSTEYDSMLNLGEQVCAILGSVAKLAYGVITPDGEANDVHSVWLNPTLEEPGAIKNTRAVALAGAKFGVLEALVLHRPERQVWTTPFSENPFPKPDGLCKYTGGVAFRTEDRGIPGFAVSGLRSGMFDLLLAALLGAAHMDDSLTLRGITLTGPSFWETGPIVKRAKELYGLQCKNIVNHWASNVLTFRITCKNPRQALKLISSALDDSDQNFIWERGNISVYSSDPEKDDVHTFGVKITDEE